MEAFGEVNRFGGKILHDASYDSAIGFSAASFFRFDDHEFEIFVSLSISASDSFVVGHRQTVVPGSGQ